MKLRILAPGESMSQSLADSLRGLNVLVINRCFELAPWALGLVAHDHSFWHHYKKAQGFTGRKFSGNEIGSGVEKVKHPRINRGSCSGALSLVVAHKVFGATEIELYGFDNRGGHYHGPHEAPMNNTLPGKYNDFARQIGDIGLELKAAGVRVVNKTPNSALECFERG